MKQLSLAITVLLFGGCTWFQPKYRSGREGQILPDFRLLKDSSIIFHMSSIPEKTPFLLFLYEPSCHYCNEEMNDIIKNIKDFKHIRFYLITDSPDSVTKQFANRHHLANYSNISMARDSERNFLSYFKAPGVPYIAYYGDNKILKKVIIGKTDFNILKDAIN